MARSRAGLLAGRFRGARVYFGIGRPMEPARMIKVATRSQGYSGEAPFCVSAIFFHHGNQEISKRALLCVKIDGLKVIPVILFRLAEHLQDLRQSARVKN